MKPLFLELLQVSLGTRDMLSRVLSVQEWECILQEAERQAIVGVLTDGLERQHRSKDHLRSFCFSGLE